MRLAFKALYFLVIILIMHNFNIYADTYDMKAGIEDSTQVPRNLFYRYDRGIHLYGRANYCLNTDHIPSETPGEYYFQYEVVDPNGIKVYSNTDGALPVTKPVPNSPQYIEERLYILPTMLIQQGRQFSPGNFTLTVSFIEKYPSINKTLSISDTISFTLLDGYDPIGPRPDFMLQQPMDNSIVGPNPQFVWTPANANAEYQVFVADSEDRNGNLEDLEGGNHWVVTNAIWASQRTRDTNALYTGHIEAPLQPGKSYYWLVAVVQESPYPGKTRNGHDIHIPLKKSYPFRFGTNEISDTDDIVLLSPVEGQAVQEAFPLFRWTSAFPPSANVEYEFTLIRALGDFKGAVLWSYSTNDVTYRYPTNAPLLQASGISEAGVERKVTYTWWVIGKDLANPEASFKKSQEVSFTYEPPVVEVETQLSGTSLSGMVKNHRNILMPETLVYLKRNSSVGCKKEDNNENLQQYSTETGSDGRFELLNIQCGTYMVYSEKLFGEFFNTFERSLEVTEGVQNELTIVMKNEVGKMYFKIIAEDGGAVIPGAIIKVKNDRFTLTGTTSATGEYTFQLPEGNYQYEIIKLPEYSPYSEQGVVVEADKFNKTISLKETTSGTARLGFRGSGTNMPLPNLKISGERIER